MAKEAKAFTWRPQTEAEAGVGHVRSGISFSCVVQGIAQSAEEAL